MKNFFIKRKTGNESRKEWAKKKGLSQNEECKAQNKKITLKPLGLHNIMNKIWLFKCEYIRTYLDGEGRRSDYSL